MSENENEITIDTGEDGLSAEQVQEAITRANKAANSMGAKELLTARMWFDVQSQDLLADLTLILLCGVHKLHGKPFKQIEHMTVNELMQAVLDGPRD